MNEALVGVVSAGTALLLALAGYLARHKLGNGNGGKLVRPVSLCVEDRARVDYLAGQLELLREGQGHAISELKNLYQEVAAMRRELATLAGVLVQRAR